MRTNSLSFRLIFTSAVVAVVLLVSAAFLLAYLFQQALVLAANTGCRYLQSQTPTWKAHAARLQAASSTSRVEIVRYVLPAATSQSLGSVMSAVGESQPSLPMTDAFPETVPEPRH